MNEYIIPLTSLMLSFISVYLCIKFIFSRQGFFWILPSALSVLISAFMLNLLLFPSFAAAIPFQTPLFSLVVSVTCAESLFFCNTESSCELLHEIVLDIECGILEQFIGYPAEVGQLVCIDLLLTECRIALCVCSVLLCPLSQLDDGLCYVFL